MNKRLLIIFIVLVLLVMGFIGFNNWLEKERYRSTHGAAPYENNGPVILKGTAK